MLWRATPREIVGCGDKGIALWRTKRDRDHVLLEMLAISHAGVEAGADDVDEPALADDLDTDFRVGLQKRPDHRRQHEIDRWRRRIDAQATRRLVTQAAQLAQRFRDV